eukprot:CAMPEP_0115015834 /NCGR_PEP_ID=MMETSP0216-20121206/27030_1 /TAXON_ID=223996 /ORGANISM="Protocruzia adherens, Strain Boccale" /LENGTH=150 /DNA_ID=CAMNT_0002386081 /DNA_START=32 /DNA_END=481 /DNA_ORIENTATION=+
MESRSNTFMRRLTPNIWKLILQSLDATDIVKNLALTSKFFAERVKTLSLSIWQLNINDCSSRQMSLESLETIFPRLRSLRALHLSVQTLGYQERLDLINLSLNNGELRDFSIILLPDLAADNITTIYQAIINVAANYYASSVVESPQRVT